MDKTHLIYLDFELEIGPGRGREYPVAVVRSPAGEARETMRFPFDELALESRLKDLQIALLRSSGQRRQILSPEEQTVQDFGRALFDALLTGELRSRYDVSLSEALRQGKGLRVKLRVQPPELAVLPWELLYDLRQADYVCLSDKTPVVRYLELPQPVQPLTITPPLRILGMIASPKDLPPLDVERETQRVERALEKLPVTDLVDLHWLPGQTWRDLQGAMRSGPWHVFHFIGHGGFDRNTDEGFIALADEGGETHRFSATQLGRLLADHGSLRLALLNSCEGARGSQRDIFSSTASILVRRGIPAVLAMQYEITDLAAIEFARAFYEAFAEGMPVDAAVTEARKAVSLALANTVEWSTPVLFMRAPQGAIFGISKEHRDGLPIPKISEPLPGSGEKLDQHLDELYTEGLNAFYLKKDWEIACRTFQAIMGVRPDYKGAAAMLEAAKKQKRLDALYAEAQQLCHAHRWQAVLSTFKHIEALNPSFSDPDELLALAHAELNKINLKRKLSMLSTTRDWITSHSSTVSSIVLALVGCVIVAVICSTLVEKATPVMPPPVTPTPISVGEKHNGTLARNERNYYSFKSSGGITVTIAIEEFHELQAIVIIYDAVTMKLVDAKDDREDSFEFAPEEGKEYVILVKGCGAAVCDSGSYILELK